MKKVLAILLAMMLMSATLVACEKEQPNLPEEEEEDDGYINSDPDDTDGEGEQNPDDGEQNPNENTDQTPSTSGWVTKNDTVYAGVQLRLRTSPSSAGTNNIAKSVDMGTKMNRSEANAKWSKVTLDGDSTTYYVSNAWLTSSNADFTFTDCADPVSLTINASDYNLCFFFTPYESEDQDAYFENVLGAGGFKLAAVTSGYSLKKIATSNGGNWIKVQFVGTVTISGKAHTYTEAAPGVFYVKMRAITRNDITDPTYTSGNSGTTIPGHG